MARMLCCGRKQNDCCQITGAPTGRGSNTRPSGREAADKCPHQSTRSYKHQGKRRCVCRQCHIVLWEIVA